MSNIIFVHVHPMSTLCLKPFKCPHFHARQEEKFDSRTWMSQSLTWGCCLSDDIKALNKWGMSKYPKTLSYIRSNQRTPITNEMECPYLSFSITFLIYIFFNYQFNFINFKCNLFYFLDFDLNLWHTVWIWKWYTGNWLFWGGMFKISSPETLRARATEDTQRCSECFPAPCLLLFPLISVPISIHLESTLKSGVSKAVAFIRPHQRWIFGSRTKHGCRESKCELYD